MAADEKLVQEALTARSGDFRAFDQLVLKHQNMVRTNCRYISGSEEDAQDLAQEVFVKAYFNLKSFQGKSQFGTWIKRIKVNHCLNHLRRQKGKTHVDIEDPALASQPQLRETRQTSAATEDRARREMISRTLDWDRQEYGCRQPGPGTETIGLQSGTHGCRRVRTKHPAPAGSRGTSRGDRQPRATD